MAIEINIDASSKENTSNKQNDLTVDGTGTKFPTVDAMNEYADQIVVALNGKANATALTNHTSNTSNPHGVTKAQVGLSNVLDVAQYPATNPSNFISGVTIDSTTITSGTDGRVLFQKAGKFGQSSGLFWDDANGRFGINQPTPTAKLHVKASDSTSSVFYGVEKSAGGIWLFQVRGDGSVFSNGLLGVSSNTIYGESSGVVASGANNSFFSYRAGFQNTTGRDNSFFGYICGYNTLGGSFNTFNGSFCGYSNVGGANNVFNGYQCGYNNISGSNNSFNGYQAGFGISSGSGNVIFGSQAGRYLADGITALTTVNNSTYLGLLTKASANNVTNEIAIGNSAIGMGSNTVTIGSTSIVDSYLRGRINLTQYATGSRPSYVKGALIFDSTLGKLVIGGNSGWEVVTSI